MAARVSSSASYKYFNPTFFGCARELVFFGGLWTASCDPKGLSFQDNLLHTWLLLNQTPLSLSTRSHVDVPSFP